MQMGSLVGLVGIVRQPEGMSCINMYGFMS